MSARAIRTVRWVGAAALIGVASACPRPVALEPGEPARPATGREVVRSMHDAWSGRWYAALRTEQRNTLVRPGGGEVVSDWVVHTALPGRQRIDYRPLERRGGVLYEHGRVHGFVDGRRTLTQPQVNVRLLLTGDVHTAPPDSVAALLDSLGFDLSSVRADEWDGRRVWIVGSAPHDTTRNQFWVDAERWILVRLIQRESAGEREWRDDLRFTQFAEHGGVPIATSAELARDGAVILRERITAVRVEPSLAPGLFDPARWAEVPLSVLERASP